MRSHKLRRKSLKIQVQNHDYIYHWKKQEEGALISGVGESKTEEVN